MKLWKFYEFIILMYVILLIFNVYIIIFEYFAFFCCFSFCIDQLLRTG
jgi:hypothetical protein